MIDVKPGSCPKSSSAVIAGSPSDSYCFTLSESIFDIGPCLWVSLYWLVALRYLLLPDR